MKLHFDGVLPPGYWGHVMPEEYNPEWVSFTCGLAYKEVKLLREYLNTFQLPYRLYPLISNYWCLNMPEPDAMQFRLRFPCPSSFSGAMKDFAEFNL